MPDYDMSIHSNPDASAWAAFFAKTFPAGSPVPDEGTMIGWFANAMMAMYDHHKLGSVPAALSSLAEARAENEKLREALTEIAKSGPVSPDRAEIARRALSGPNATPVASSSPTADGKEQP